MTTAKPINNPNTVSSFIKNLPQGFEIYGSVVGLPQKAELG